MHSLSTLPPCNVLGKSTDMFCVVQVDEGGNGPVGRFENNNAFVLLPFAFDNNHYLPVEARNNIVSDNKMRTQEPPTHFKRTSREE